MNQVINTIASMIITLGMFIFMVIVIILNNIDEFIEWLNKKINKR